MLYLEGMDGTFGIMIIIMMIIVIMIIVIMIMRISIQGMNI